jgi:peptide deformylase
MCLRRYDYLKKVEGLAKETIVVDTIPGETAIEVVEQYYRLESCDYTLGGQVLAIIPREQTPEANVDGKQASHDLIKDVEIFIKSIKKEVVGIASNQLSLNGKRLMQRFFLFRADHNEPFKVALNPVTEKAYGLPSEKIERCLTWGDDDVVAERYEKLDVSYETLAGEVVRETLGGFEAQVWQHEIDHVNGKDHVMAVPGQKLKKAPVAGRNDLCPCGSGKKYKKCCLV